MRSAIAWESYVRSIAEHSKDLAVYAQQWAHDVRCIRFGAEHRRVGELTVTSAEWLQAGIAARQTVR